MVYKMSVTINKKEIEYIGMNLTELQKKSENLKFNSKIPDWLRQSNELGHLASYEERGYFIMLYAPLDEVC